MSNIKTKEKRELWLIMVVLFSPILLTLDFVRPNIIYFAFGLNLLIVLIFLIEYRYNLKDFFKTKQYNRLIFMLFIIMLLEVYNMTSIGDLKLFFLFVSLIIFPILVLNLSHFTIKQIIVKYTTIFITLGVIFTVFALITNLFSISIYEDSIGYYYQVSEFFPNIYFRQKIMGLGLSRRYSSMFSNPNGFGFFMFNAMFLLHVSNILSSKKNNLVRIVLLLGLLMSQSRAAILCYLVIEILLYGYGLFVRKKAGMKYIIKAKENKILIVSFCFIILIIVSLLTKFRGGLSLNGRIDPWLIGIEQFKSNIFTGMGTLNFNKFINEAGYIHSHNTYVQLLASGGIFYLISYLALFRSIIKELNSNKLFIPSEIDVLVKIYFISVFIYQFVETNILTYHYHIVILILIYILTKQVGYQIPKGEAS